MTGARCQVCGKGTDLTVRGLPGHPPYVDVCPDDCYAELVAAMSHDPSRDWAATIQCTDYQSHQLEHRWSTAERRWLCQACEVAA